MKTLFVDVDNICYEGTKSGSLRNSIGMIKEISSYNSVEILEIYNSKDSNTDRNNPIKTFHDYIEGIKVTNIEYDLINISNFISENAFDYIIITLFSVFLEKKDLDLLELLQKHCKKLVININDILYVKYDQLTKIDALQYKNILKKSTIISCSNFVRNNVKKDLGVESIVIYPLTNISTQTVDKIDDYITFINPIELKGLKVFEKVAEIMPEKKFLVVCGWQESEKYEAKTKNVKVIPFQENILNVWKQTKILLALSIVPEAYCRVVTESMLNNCEVIGFDVGGIKEAACGMGTIIKPIINHGSTIYPRLDSSDIELKAIEIKNIIENIKFDKKTDQQVLSFLKQQQVERNSIYRRIFNE